MGLGGRAGFLSAPFEGVLAGVLADGFEGVDVLLVVFAPLVGV